GFRMHYIRDGGPHRALQSFPTRRSSDLDGRKCFTAGLGPIRHWDIPVPVQGDPERIRTWVEVMTGLGFDEAGFLQVLDAEAWRSDRKSTRLNSSHRTISYAVFCWKKRIL